MYNSNFPAPRVKKLKMVVVYLILVVDVLGGNTILTDLDAKSTSAQLAD